MPQMLWHTMRWRRQTSSAGVSNPANATVVIDFGVDNRYHFPFGWGELWGISNRGSFDLEQHSAASGCDLRLQGLAPDGKGKDWPHVVEPALGLDRLT